MSCSYNISTNHYNIPNCCYGFTYHSCWPYRNSSNPGCGCHLITFLNVKNDKDKYYPKMLLERQNVTPKETNKRKLKKNKKNDEFTVNTSTLQESSKSSRVKRKSTVRFDERTCCSCPREQDSRDLVYKTCYADTSLHGADKCCNAYKESTSSSQCEEAISL